MPSDDFGMGYVLKEVVDAVREIRAALPMFATRAEVDQKIAELERRQEQGPIKPWFVSTTAMIVAVASVIYTVSHH